MALTHEKCEKAYHELSSVAGQVTRQASYAGIALIWIFYKPNTKMDWLLVASGISFLVSIAADLLTYVVSSYLWAAYSRLVELRQSTDAINLGFPAPWNILVEEKLVDGTPLKEEFHAPRYINWPYNFFAFCRYLWLLIGYTFSLIFLIKTLNF